MRFLPTISLFLVFISTIDDCIAQSAPVAVNDNANTAENTQVIINVIANDTDLDSDINAATVDLNTSLEDIQDTYSDASGVFAADASGTVTYTPANEFSGTATASYTVSDNQGLTSGQATITVTVNDLPLITGQDPDPLTTAEDNPITIDFSHLLVTDTDDTYPEDFSLTLFGGDNYTFAGTTVTPAPGFNGTLTVPVRVNDGADNSPEFDLAIEVTAENDPPSIDGQDDISTLEDTPFTLLTSHLTISDPDNTTEFTIIVSPGDDYTAVDNVITPAADFSGTLSIPIQVSDGALTSSPPFNLALEVTPVNDIPVIDGQDVLSTAENQDITILLDNLNVTDVDDTYPTDFSLTLFGGDNYTFTGTTVTPAPGFNGTLTVPVRVNDGADNSPEFDLAIEVTAENDPPSINGQQDISTPEDTPFTLLTSHLTISDPDNTTEFTIIVSPGDDYTAVDNVITPAANFSGTLSIPVQVSDGALTSSPPFNLALEVTPVNDIPVIDGQDVLSTSENQDITILLDNLNVTDVDDTYPTDFSLTLFGGDNYTFTGTTVTPAPGFNGTLTVPVRVNDGADNSPEFDLAIEVTAENDPPSIDGQDDISTLEDTPFTLLTSHLTISDPDNTTEFTIIVSPGDDYTAVDNVITPSPNFYGTLSIPIQASDGGLTSSVFNLELEVTPVNDIPVIDGQDVLSTSENQDITILLDNLNVTDVDDTYPTDFSLTLFGGDNYTFTGTTVTPAPGFNGTLTVPVRVNDGADNSPEFDLAIEVTAENDPPSIDGQDDISTLEDTPFTLLTSHLTISDPDNTTEFTIIVSPGDDYTFVDNVITPAADFSGTLSIPVQVSDGALTSSPPFNLALEVTPVNDVPSIDGQDVLSTSENQDITILLDNLNVTDVDDTYPEDFSLTLFGGDNYTFTGTTVTPAPGFNGTLTVPVRVNDGADNSPEFDLAIEVTAENDPPSINGQQDISTPEDTPFTLLTSHLTISDPDNTTEFTIIVSPGDDYTFVDNVITPSPNFYGTLSIPIQVSDGGLTSSLFNLALEVTPVNDVPSIDGQDVLSTSENQDITILLDNLNVTDVDDTYPTDFSLTLFGGDNYTFAGTTVTPAPGFNGTLTVPVRVNDGADNSPEFDLAIEVTAENDPPSIDGQDNISTLEDTPFTLLTSHLTISDPDNTTEFTIIVSPGDDYTAVDNVITPSPNFYGTLSIPIQVSDGALTSSPPFNLALEVTPVNDIPVIDGQDVLSTSENQDITILLDNLNVTDVDDTYPTDFSLTLFGGDNYTFAGTTVTPAPGFNGTLTVPVRVNDGADNSPEFDLAIEVTAENDPPSINGQDDISTLEDTPFTLLTSHLTISDPDNTTEFTIIVSPGDDYTAVDNVITPAANFSGTLSIPVQVSDGGLTSSLFNLALEVTPVNDIPVIDGQDVLSTAEETAITILPSHLTINDPDNSSFTLIILPAANYSFTGTKITPSPDFNGTLSVPVQVSDGSLNSENFNLQLEVTPVNDVPVITGQSSLAINEEEAILIQLSHVTVTDADNTFPTDFTLSVLAGTNYTVSENTVTPATDHTGTLPVRVQVNDGSASSAVFNLLVEVNPENDAPAITGQLALSTPEETALTIQLSKLIIDDPDNSSGFTFELFPGSDYTVAGNTVTPVQNFNGTLSVPVQVNDGLAGSNIFTLEVEVTPVNDAPVIIGQTLLSTDEDIAIDLLASQLTILDPDNTSGFMLSISPGENYSFTGNTVTPALDFNGTINVSIRVSDGNAVSPPFTLQVQVGDANDPPVITGQVPLTTNEDEAITIQLSHLTVTDPDNSYPDHFSINVAPGSNYSVSGNVVTPAPDFFGDLTVPVNVNDGINNSALFNLQITVKVVNDVPSFDPIPNQQVMENSGEQTLTIRNISKGTSEDTQSLIFIASSGNTKIVSDPVVTYNGLNSSAQLVYTVLPNVSGAVTITVRAVDNGTPAAIFTSSFQIEVAEVNAMPTLDELSNLTIQEDAATQEIILSGITAGIGENQQLTVTVSASHPEFFDPLPQIVYQGPATTGTLQITPKANVSGSTEITVTVTDNGSNIAPHVNTISKTFSLTIQSVNDIPVFQSAPGLMAVLNEPYEYILEVEDVENESITFSFLQKPSWLTFTGTGNGKGKLSGSPSVSGQVPVTIVATDISGGAAEQAFLITVNSRPALSPIRVSSPEDQLVILPFPSAFTDADGNTLTELKITALPDSGTLTINDAVVTEGSVIPSALLSRLIYEPMPNYSGKDTVRFTASDGFHYSLDDTYAALEITPVNDPPVITMLETDTLSFEVDGEPKSITSEFEANDVDDEMLAGATVAFALGAFIPETDVLLFTNTATITGSFNSSTGSLSLAGKASTAEYREAIRSIQYNHLNTIDPILGTKTVTISLTDGKNLSNPAERLIKLTYTFTDLDIPTGFTPNGDNINDTWIIAQPGGQLQNAVIKVFNKKGKTIYESTGFDKPWDGTFNGELLPPDTYYFTIDLKLPNKKTYKGFITLIR